MLITVVSYLGLFMSRVDFYSYFFPLKMMTVLSLSDHQQWQRLLLLCLLPPYHLSSISLLLHFLNCYDNIMLTKTMTAVSKNFVLQ